MNLRTKFKKIAQFHKGYARDFLYTKASSRDSYLGSNIKGLFFVFSYCFYQGRRDELSERFQKLAQKAFKLFIKQEKINILDLSVKRIYDKEKLIRRYDKLYKILKEEGVNKEGDRLMVISVINFIQSNEEKNIVRFLIRKIKERKVAEAYDELDSIWSIGGKIAALILRDIVYIYKLEKFLASADYCFLQPVDTWVHQISQELKLTKHKYICPEEAVDLAKSCLKVKVNPIHFNQGAWYLGANSTRILLENLEKMI